MSSIHVILVPEGEEKEYSAEKTREKNNGSKFIKVSKRHKPRDSTSSMNPHTHTQTPNYPCLDSHH